MIIIFKSICVFIRKYFWDVIKLMEVYKVNLKRAFALIIAGSLFIMTGCSLGNTGALKGKWY